MTSFICLRTLNLIHCRLSHYNTYRRARYPTPPLTRFQLSAKTPESARTVPKFPRSSSWHLTSCSETPLWSSAHAFTLSSSICLVCYTTIVDMEVIKGLFGKAQEVAQVVAPQERDDGYSRDISTCPGTSTTLLGA